MPLSGCRSMDASPFTASVDGAVRRMGLATEVAAILMVLFGVLIIVFPALVAWILGLLLVLVGVVLLVSHLDARRHHAMAPVAPPPSPPTSGP